ncbi:hypothetical protein GMLC_38450 [Geomonas limicola]|uniref:Pilus assembly protein PilO n=1 Tax=Geomonas limicola TaxID=2740186 RepID=A0A6V8NCJ9_9BACT|nr:type 4a pilus biogenesis protein PilO [Geomonas limicola]GFO70266.1 hypothetical protein GMLC_38450 [Geomonas limicola]
MNLDLIKDIYAQRRRIFGLIFFLALVNLVLAVYVSQWQTPQLATATKEWSARQQAALKGQDRGEAARFRDNQRDLATFEERYIAKKDFAAFLSDLFGIAKANSLSLKGINYQPTQVKNQPLVTYVIEFTLSGRYGGVKGFIADLARYPKLVVLNSISLANTSKTEESVDLKVQLTVYLKKEGA